MTRQNRVLPDGSIVASPFRGTWMGNRGGPLTLSPRRQPWAGRAWIYCHLDFRGRNRVLGEPGRRYTELFFHDEAHALAAGHRPCGECQRARLRAFKQAAGFSVATPVAEVDRLLHEQRRGGPTRMRWATLPVGAMAEVDGVPVLVGSACAWRWSPAGYTRQDPPVDPVAVLTPAITLIALHRGFDLTTAVPALPDEGR